MSKQKKPESEKHIRAKMRASVVMKYAEIGSLNYKEIAQRADLSENRVRKLLAKAGYGCMIVSPDERAQILAARAALKGVTT